MIKRLSTLAALAVAATCVFSPSTAQAAEADQCWYEVETGKSACFTTFSAMVADLSGGQVRVSGGATTMTTAQASAVAAASVTAAVVYEDANFGGASTALIVGSTCDSNVDVDHSMSLVGGSWNDRISSFKSYNGCQTKLWTNTYSGVSYGFTAQSSNVGPTMNDLASSVQWQ